MGNFKQKSFSGGMDMLSNDTDIVDGCYRYGFNFRQRYGSAYCIQKSLDITFNLIGKFQGLYAVGSVWVAFYSGRAYYMPINGTTWFLIPGLQLDAFVPVIYVAAVAGSINNYLRQAVVTANTDPVSGITTNVINASAGVIQTPFFVSGTPAGLVCQDGINQPWIITYDSVNNNATARILGNYNQWDNSGQSNNNQEYVPIGTLMYNDGTRLYIVNGNMIYRSVSGAPLNFMVNIDTNGNKLATEALGGASTTSFAVDFDPINYIGPSTTEANTFVIGTSRNIYLYQPDFTTTIFGEPTFDKAGQLVSGVVNQFCMADNNGDTVFIDYKGVKSFNAVQTLKFAGRNSPFSKNLSGAIDGIQQNICCVFSFDNYVRFSINTIYGYCVAVYDNINAVWVGFDITSATTSGIKMFAQADLLDSSYLAAGCVNNKIFLVEGDVNNVEPATAQMRSFVPGSYNAYGVFVADPLDTEHKLAYIRAEVTNDTIGGTMSVHEKVDEQSGQKDTKNVDGLTAPILFPILWPVEFNGVPRVQDITFALDQGRTGYKIHPIVTWQSNCTLNKIDIITSSSSSPVSQKQQQKSLTGTLS